MDTYGIKLFDNEYEVWFVDNSGVIVEFITMSAAIEQLRLLKSKGKVDKYDDYEVQIINSNNSAKLP
jgi:hypothetical protein